MTALWIVLGIVAVLGLWLMMTYNGLVRLSNLKDEGWSGIDVQLKRRFDLIPNLVETVKAYAAHEKDTLQGITEARAAVSSATTVEERIGAENKLTNTLKSLFAVAENYPELKANVNFMQLQEELSKIEDEIQMSRRYYNGTARDYNISVQKFPTVLVAGMLGYKKAAFFEVDEAEKAAPKVKF